MMRSLAQKNQKVYSYNTAIKRSKPSAPLKYLLDKDLLYGNILDYGCGRGFDSEYLRGLNYSVDSYDPHWNPNGINRDSYDSIFCNYVLNVLQTDSEILSVMQKATSFLSDNGKAYFAVRRDVKKVGFTSRGFQRKVFLSAPILYEKSGSFCTYIVDKENVASHSIRVIGS